MTTITRSKSTTRETWTRRTPQGDILALSSDGSTIYRVTLAPDACECPGFAWRKTCRHLDAARARYAEPAGCPTCAASPLGVCYSCASAPTSPRAEISDLYN